jgi:pilus assembly protein CpaF
VSAAHGALAPLPGPDRCRPDRSAVADPELVGRLAAAVRARLGDRLDATAVGDEVAAVLRGDGVLVGPRALARTVRAVCDEVLGAGPLQPWLDDPLVTDVLVNGPQQVWVERAGALTSIPVDLGGVEEVRSLAVRLAARAGRRLDDASPAVDARLPDGTRLHALLPPLSGDCTSISLRVVRPRPYSVAELVSAGTIAAPLVPVLTSLVEQRANLLLTGATGSGKTTLLGALLELVDPGQRILVVEEAPELVVQHPHVVHLATRTANVEGAGAVGLSELVRHALRMRPDRIVLGECRGAEVRDVLAALNTGHEGSCATMHANAASDVPARLEALAALAGMSRSAVAAQAASAFDAVLHLHRDGPGRRQRRLHEIAVVGRDRDGELVVDLAVTVLRDGGLRRGPGWPALARRLGRDPVQDEALPPGVVALGTRRAGSPPGLGHLAGEP